MIPLFTPAQVREMDRRVIAAGTGSLQLMERAAGHLARAVLRAAGRSYGLRVALLCGKGNNGGDGIAAARHLRAAGAWPVVCLTGDPADLSADAAVQLVRWRAVGGRVRAGGREVLDRADIAVDCLLGTGTTGSPRAPYDTVIDDLNARPVPVVACDLPSGVDADTGEVAGKAVRADLTLTLGAHKRGLVLWPARAYTGDLQVADIGIRGDDDRAVAHIVEDADIPALLPDPANDSDKRGLGAVVIVAGSADMSGAAVLCARGALAAGAGLVTIATSPLARRLVAPNVPEAMSLEVPTDDPDAAFERIAAACERANALAIGPGLGHEPPQVDLVRRCVGELSLPTIVDADGINAFRHDAKALADHAADALVITPHRSELSRLLADHDDALWPRRIEGLPDRARELRATVVAKGPGTVIAAADGRVWVDAAGTVALATGGTGDVLTGMTVAALAAGTDPARVAATVALHGLAGQTAAAERTVRSVTSLDVARAVPQALRRLRDR
jgi:ADP-dependent NAD(P)H-hydrate dehydratase / NAD(P)H-hydrate epimerase